MEETFGAKAQVPPIGNSSRTDDKDLAIRVLEHMKRELGARLRRRRRDSKPGGGVEAGAWGPAGLNGVDPAFVAPEVTEARQRAFSPGERPTSSRAKCLTYTC